MHMKSKHIFKFIFVLFVISSGLPLFSQTAPSDSEIQAFLEGHGFDKPVDVFTAVEEIIFPKTYYTVMEMKTVQPGKRDRTLTLESWYSKGKGTLMEFLSPSRQKGIRILQKEQALWLYNPRSNSPRPVRLSPQDSFQGSVFSNNDIGDPQYSDDYNARIASIEKTHHDELGNITVVTIEGTASHQKAPYGKIVMKIDAESLLPVETDYYARSGLLFKHMVFSDFRQIAGRKRSCFFKMDSLEIDGFYSTVELKTLEARDSIEDWRFNESALTRR